MKFTYTCNCQREYKTNPITGISNLDGRSKGSKDIKKNYCIVCFMKCIEARNQQEGII